MSPTLELPCAPNRSPATAREARRRAADLAACDADAQIRQVVLDLLDVGRRLEEAIQPLAGRKGRARQLWAAAECAARDLLPSAVRGLRAGLAGRQAGEP